MLKTEKYQPHK